MYILLPNALDIRSSVVSAFPVLSSQWYYGSRLTGSGSGQQESGGRLPVMATAAAMAVTAGQRYVTGTAQRYDGTGIIVPRHFVFSVSVINSENGISVIVITNLNASQTRYNVYIIVHHTRGGARDSKQ